MINNQEQTKAEWIGGVEGFCFMSVCICMTVCMVHVCAVALGGQERALGSWELTLRRVVSCYTCAGKPPSARTTIALNCLVISPAPAISVFNLKNWLVFYISSMCMLAELK